jgi:hypothetical protein
MNGLEPLKVLYKPGQSLGLIAQVSFLLLLSINIKIPFDRPIYLKFGFRAVRTSCIRLFRIRTLSRPILMRQSMIDLAILNLDFVRSEDPAFMCLEH